MSEKRQQPRTKRGSVVDDDQVAALLRAAGRRPEAPEETEGRVRASIHEEWRRALRARRRRVWAWSVGSLAAAAGVAVVAGLLVRASAERVQSPEPPPVMAATAEVILGSVIRRMGNDGADRWQPLESGDRLLVGSTVESPIGGRAALRLANGSSLRLDTDTRVRFETLSRLALARGRLYVDSEGVDDPSTRLEVHTPMGLVQELGTQFEVYIAERAMRVRVREGAIVLARDGERFDAEAGGEITVASDGGVIRGSVAEYGSEWSWVLELAPSFEIEGRRLGAFLGWSSRETGWRVRFEPPELGEEIASVVLHGSIRGLRPDQALEAVLPTCGLTFSRSGGVVEVGRAGTAP